MRTPTVFIRFGLILILSVLISFPIRAQDNSPANKISASVMAPLVFSFTNANDFVQEQIIRNALELRIKVKQENVVVQGKVNVFGGNDASSLASLMTLRLSHKTSPDAMVPAIEVPVGRSYIPLFMQPRTFNGTKHYEFLYDVILRPSRTIIAPGNYTFSFDFTISPQ